MNKIERMFYNALLKRKEDLACDIGVQEPVGIYRSDFIVEGIIVEIDGHEYHKTKEQREKDYKKDRYFKKEGYDVVRFMGTEVFLNADKCVEETINIANLCEQKIITSFIRVRELYCATA